MRWVLRVWSPGSEWVWDCGSEWVWDCGSEWVWVWSQRSHIPIPVTGDCRPEPPAARGSRVCEELVSLAGKSQMPVCTDSLDKVYDSFDNGDATIVSYKSTTHARHWFVLVSPSERVIYTKPPDHVDVHEQFLTLVWVPIIEVFAGVLPSSDAFEMTIFPNVLDRLVLAFVGQVPLDGSRHLS